MAKRLFGVTLMLLCVASAVSAGEDEEWLKKTRKALEDAFNAGDAKAAAAFYAPDAMLLPPNVDFVQGRESIAEFIAEAIASVKGNLKFELQEVFVQGDLAYLLGTTKILSVDGEFVDRVKYVEIWKRREGQWELYRDIWRTLVEWLT